MHMLGPANLTPGPQRPREPPNRRHRRGKYLYRIARRIQERARELAVLETHGRRQADQGIRDVDIPSPPQHFFYHAGWADKLEYAFPGRSPARRRVRADHPVELPAADGRVEDRARAGLRQHGGAQARRDHAAHRLRLAEIFEESAARRAWSTSSPAMGAPARPSSNHPGRRQDRLHRLDRVGKRIAAARRHRQESSRSNWAARAPNIIFEDASIDQAIEGIIQGIYFNQGHVCCAGSRLLVQESILDEVIEKLERPHATLRVGDPLDKNTDVGAINSKAQLGPSAHYLKIGQDEGATLARRWNRLHAAHRRASGAARASSPACSPATRSPARRSSAPCSRS
jgi:aldehyde dehydrogenase (NAD+)